MLLLCLPVVSASAQKQDTTIYTVVEQSAEFPGGVDKFYSFIGKHLRVPAATKGDDVFGKRVIISFIVEKNGMLSHFAVKQKFNPLMFKEVVRILESSPRWKPALVNGKAVRMRYLFPLNIEPQMTD